MSQTLALALKVIGGYEREAGKRKYWSDWLAYLHEARVEDFVFADAEKVLVSTMHKAKGKEFDHVFLLLQHYPILREDSKRVVYVAITRAKDSLHIHTDQSCFNRFAVPGFKITREEQLYSAPAELQLELGMGDVWLNFYKHPRTIEIVKQITAAYTLSFAADPAEGLRVPAGKAVKFSQKFKEELLGLLNQGYRCSHAEAAYVVVWYCEEEGKECRVVLPRIVLKKEGGRLV